MSSTPIVTRTFDQSPNDQAFAAFHRATHWLEHEGYSVGQLSRGNPIAIKKGRFDFIAKWRNLTSAEKADIEGKMTGNWRNGPITVELYQ